MEPQLAAGTAPSERVAVQRLVYHGRYGTEGGSYAAPQRRARSSRDDHAPRRRLRENDRLLVSRVTVSHRSCGRS